NSDNGPSDLTIRAVNAGNVAEFTSTTDLNGFGSSLSDPIQWIPPAWTAGSEDVKTDAAHGLVTAQDLRDLLQTVVSRNDYTPQSFVAFLITGSGTRRAWAFEGQGDNKKDPGKPAKLIVSYTPRKIPQDIMTCGDTRTTDSKNAVCQNLQANVDPIAKQCKLAKSCTCTVKSPEETKFSDACNKKC